MAWTENGLSVGRRSWLLLAVWASPVITSAAVLFRVVIDATAPWIQDCLAVPFFIAVEITPVPRAFVSSNTSLGLAPEFGSTRRGSIRPVTEYPNLVSSSPRLGRP